ncbi:hypothetical protein Acy02nite_63960 [Actinoplanes cyaneus]|uniref:Gram-positive cocci surface proteins LPxTG domain-containing protein n=1 Tax=Actinoplanes cyaneus TaxID=52696 RepID=A0A919IUY7_9ACTN|nr:hypothetical protein [Actinoplanes cyaneus]MCW2141881.1 hypothetical protein [Actinoplanes cyaneus]GID68515.1 hypothetical protein Acy02nite_63960 [Actinoplanes cyaneus]
MTPVRSLAAGIAALGFASTLTVSLPAQAASPLHRAPAPCERTGRYAAQSEAEFLRIERLDLRGARKREHGAGVTKRDSGERPSVSAPGSPERAGGDAPADESDIAVGGSGSAPAAGGSAAGAAPDTGGDDGRAGGQTGSQNTDDQSPAGTGPHSGTKAPESATRPRGLLSGVGDLLGGLVPAAYRARDDDRTEPAEPSATSDGDGTRVISGVGVGDSRSVMIADGPVKSAAAGLLLDGRVAGAPAAEQVLQQAPPSHGTPLEQHTGSKRFGPIQVGAGAMSAHARWNPAMRCAAADGETSRSVTRAERMTLGGGLVDVPGTFSATSSTALSGHGNGALTVASSTISAGQFTLAGGEVRVRVLRAPTLRVSMSATAGGEVRYRPAVVEISGPTISRTRLSTGSDHVDVTVSDIGQVTESSAVTLLPSQGSPVPSIPGLPAPSGGSGGGAPARASAPADGKTVVRVSLGDVRQASKGHALAARATAIKVAVVRPAPDKGRGKAGYASTAVVADLGIGVLEAAAVAPEHGKRVVESGVRNGTLPMTGPRIAPMLVMGASLLVGGVLAVLLSARRRRAA